MLIDWIKLVPALVLLLTPIGLFHGERVRYRDVGREWDGYWVRTLRLGLHTIDFLRAVLGAWLLAEALQKAPGVQGLMKYSEIVVHASILCLATVLQTLICKEPESANAPFAFVAGLVLGFVPPLVAVFALVLASVLALGLRSAAVFFPLFAVGIVAAGYLFTGKSLQFDLLSAGVAVALPWLATLLFPRQFVSTYRARSKTVPLPPPR